MLLYDVIHVLRNTERPADNMSLQETYDFLNQMTEKPHYYMSASNLKKMTTELFLKNPELDPKETFVKDVTLPHDEFMITIIDDQDHSSIDEALLHIFDLGEEIHVLAYFEFTGLKRYEHVHVRGKLTDPEDGRPGCLFNFEHHNLTKRFGEDQVTDAMTQIGQYIFNTILHFNFVINKSKDVREGTEKRSFKSDPTAKGKKAYSNVTVIHLNSHRYLKSKGYKTVGAKIDWNNSWVVRGHWRYFQINTRLGKNRAGDRAEKGRTWVVPYQKQKHLTLVNKTREVRE